MSHWELRHRKRKENQNHCKYRKECPWNREVAKTHQISYDFRIDANMSNKCRKATQMSNTIPKRKQRQQKHQTHVPPGA